MNRPKRFRAGVGVTVLTFALALSACGDNDPDSDAAESSDGGLSGEAVLIGVQTNSVGPTAFPEQAEAAEAVESYINNELGGINGRPVKLDICRGDGTPEKGVECANGFVSEDVVAVYDAQDFGISAALPILQEAKIPIVGVNTGVSAVTEAPYGTSFYWGGPSAISAVSLLTFLKDAGADSASLAVSEASTSHDYVDGLLKPVGESLGVEVTGVYMDADNSNYSVLAQTALANEPGVAGVISLPDAQCTGVLGAILDAGFEGKIWAGACGGFVSELGGKAAGAVLQPRLWPLGSKDNAPDNIQVDLEAYEGAMKAAGYEDSAGGTAALYTFAGLVNLTRVIQGIDGDITADSTTQGLQAVKDFQGFAGDTYTCDGEQWPGQPASCTARALFLEVQDDGTMSPVNEGGYADLDTSILGG